MAAPSFNLDYEKNLIAGVLQYPEIYHEVFLIKSSDFSRTNQTIWELLSKTIQNAEVPTPLLLAEKLKNVGVTLEIDIFDYLESLRILPIDKKGIFEIAKSIRRLSLLRLINGNCDKLKAELVHLKDAPIGDIFKALSENLGNSLMTIESDGGEPINLYDGLEEFIENKGEDQTEIGYTMPFPLWDEYFGPLRKKNVYNFAARAGSGKSTFLSYVGDSVANDCNPGKNIKVLFLDTEMDESDQRIRIVAARTKCPYHLVDTGKWRNDPDWMPKMREGLKKLKDQNRNMWFKQVASMGIDDLVNYVKRWFYKQVGVNGNALIVYDYMKVLKSDGDGKTQEWQLALQKMQKLKDLANDLNAPLLTAIQVLRSGSTTNKSSDDVVDDESVISISGRLDWLVAFNAILRKKAHDEMALHGEEFGSHAMIPLKARYQGRTAQGHHDLVKVVEKGKVKYKTNFLCYDIDNFSVEEVGDFRNIAKLKGWTKMKKDEGTKSGLL